MASFHLSTLVYYVSRSAPTVYICYSQLQSLLKSFLFLIDRKLIKEPNWTKYVTVWETI